MEHNLKINTISINSTSQTQGVGGCGLGFYVKAAASWKAQWNFTR